VSKKKSVRKAKWHRLTEMVMVDGEIVSVGEDQDPVLVSEKLYTADGEPVLLVARVPMGAVAPGHLEMLRQLINASINADDGVETLITDSAVEMMKLAPMSDIDARRLIDQLRRREQEQGA